MNVLLSKILEKEKRKWVLEEDATLVSCMVDMYNVETYNADTGFKVDYLNELERMLEKVLPYAMLKFKPNLELRIKTLERDWVIVYDMLTTRKDAQTVTDIVEEIDVEDVATTNNLEEGNNYHGCEDNVSLNEMDVSATQSQPSNEQISTSITDVAMLLREKHTDYWP
ncbi:hypothetical protein Gogos_014561 [Gossypium gossypioides]|uniref:Myb/SANT-like domain-containing protein n=1 Tax=Gossypium gossypioides TaxID=34282 RepID=A0A7J9BZ17_GOSGO|nr:hypothetical protein [Gossypium gossypioides]